MGEPRPPNAYGGLFGQPAPGQRRGMPRLPGGHHGDGIHDDEEEALARAMRESELDFQRFQELFQQNMHHQLGFEPEERKADIDQSSN